MRRNIFTVAFYKKRVYNEIAYSKSSLEFASRYLQQRGLSILLAGSCFTHVLTYQKIISSLPSFTSGFGNLSLFEL